MNKKKDRWCFEPSQLLKDYVWAEWRRTRGKKERKKRRDYSQRTLIVMQKRGCLPSDVCKSLQQEVAIWFTYNFHISSKYSPLLCTQFQSSAPRFKGILLVGRRQCVELWIFCICRVLNLECGNISTQPTCLWWGGTSRSHVQPSWDCRGDWARTWRFCSLRKVTVTLALWALRSFGISFLSGTVEYITFWIMPDNHMADQVNIILCMVIGSDLKFFLIQVLTM